MLEKLILLAMVQVSTYSVLILWFWRNPIAAIPEQLVQPFGNTAMSLLFWHLTWTASAPLIYVLLSLSILSKKDIAQHLEHIIRKSVGQPMF